MGFQSIRPLVPFKKPEAVRCRIHQNKENGLKGTRLALAARTSRKANSEWLSIWPSLGSYRCRPFRPVRFGDVFQVYENGVYQDLERFLQQVNEPSQFLGTGTVPHRKP